MTNVSATGSHTNGKASTCSVRPSIMGIWRLGNLLHASATAEISLAQPADAVGSPRWDYVIKRAVCVDSRNEVEAKRQIVQFIAATTGIAHPNLVPVLDGSTTAPSPYLVMPLLEGQSMQAHMASTPANPLPVALWLVRQVAQALEAVHAAGWVHGDIKPANVMVGPRGHVTLIDLGFAARVHTVTNHHFRGTPTYAAPERLSGQLASMPAMDIFSLGRVLWQWLATIEPASHSQLEPVAELIEDMVAENPSERPSAGQVVKHLLRLEIETLGHHIGPQAATGRRRAA